MLEIENYQLYVCLPFLHLDVAQPINMGPIRFYPSDYITGATVAIHPSIPEEKYGELLLDGLYLLYFSATYKDLYHGTKTPHFEAFTKIIPTPEKHREAIDFDKLEALTSIEDNIYHLSSIDPVMCHALGGALNHIYLPSASGADKPMQDEMRRLIRAIRYFVHCFYDKFVNLAQRGIELNDPTLFEAEDMLFLSAAFEGLFHLDPKMPAADLKQKIRPILELKFGKPVEAIWKWVDGFMQLKDRVVHTGETPHDAFDPNETFHIPYVTLAMKLFIYSIYAKLVRHGLITIQRRGPYYPLEFPGLEREEVVSFLWSEETLLKKLSLLAIQIDQGHATDEIVSDLQKLASIYLFMVKKFYLKKDKNGEADYHPASKEHLKPYAEAIKNISEDKVPFNGRIVHLKELYPQEFLASLERRVA